MGLSLHRRTFVMSLAALPFIAAQGDPAIALSSSKMTVFRDPNCGCCGAWIEHIRAAGFPVEVVETSRVGPVKTRLGVPPQLAACHTAEIGDYAIEGHVPAPAIMRLLVERPNATGLAVRGMPVGSPGMEAEGAPPEEYDVVLFGPTGQRRFARYKGAQELRA